MASIDPTAAQCETCPRVHTYPTLGHRPLGLIRRSEVQAWIKGLTTRLAPGSVELVYRWVATIFKAAVGDRVIALSPCVRIALPKKADSEVIPLSVSEVTALADAVPLRYRGLIVFAAGMGLRQGECFGLTIDRVDFLRRQVRVDRQVTLARAGIPQFGPPESKAGFRTVPIPDVVSTELAARLARHRTGPAGLVFTTTHGTPWAAVSAGRCGGEPGSRPDSPPGRPSTTSVTSTPPCSSPRAARSGRSRSLMASHLSQRGRQPPRKT